MNHQIDRRTLTDEEKPPGSIIVRPLVALAVLALCACKPTPPTAARAEPAAAVPGAAVPEPKGEDDARCKCPSEASAAAEATVDAAAGETVDDEGPDALTRGARARRELPRALAARLHARLPDHRAACDVALSGPCVVRGDLDGDGVLDDAVLVRSRAGAGGIAILWGTGAAELLGGGRRGQCWTRTEVPDLEGRPGAPPCAQEIDADLDWLARWELRPRRLRNDGPVLVGRIGVRTVESPAPGAFGDGLLLDGGDAAAVLYRTAGGWMLMHLGY